MDLETRIARLEAAESIRILKAHYCDLCDTGYDVEALGSLFVEDAAWDGGDLGTFEGVDAIKRFFRHMPKVLRFAIHHVTNQRQVERFGKAETYTWTEDKARQYASPERADFGAFVKSKGFLLK